MRTPPQWLRHVTPWWFLYWLNKRTESCWSGMVSWKLGYSSCQWAITRVCFNLNHPDPQYHHDYCGRYPDDWWIAERKDKEGA